MKRCPACKRVEPDDALVFCRADGTPLVSDSGPVSSDAGTVKFGSQPVASETDISILAQTITDADMSRSTAPTTVLPAPHTPVARREPGNARRRKARAGSKTIALDPNLAQAHASMAQHDIALLHVGLGDKEKALAWLDKAVSERDFAILSIKAAPVWDSLRSDPRFDELLRRIGLPQ